VGGGDPPYTRVTTHHHPTATHMTRATKRGERDDDQPRQPAATPAAPPHPTRRRPSVTEQSAQVDVLTAEVRALMIGRRQVTLSVFRQLDWVCHEAVEPFGRVNSGEKWPDSYRDSIPHLAVVGRVRDGFASAGGLVRSRIMTDRQYPSYRRLDYSEQDWAALMAEWDLKEAVRAAFVSEWTRLPLIVLAGLR
jgi:hypothetical protein